MDALVKLQQVEYRREGINVEVIDFPDNSKQIELIDHKNRGVMAMLDEECAVPKGSEKNYVEKMAAAFKDNPLFELPKRGKKGSLTQPGSVAKHNPGRRGSADVGSPGAVDPKKLDGLQFLLTHYAGPVQYTALNWMDKNRGTLHPDLANVLSNSDSRLVAAIFPMRSATEKRATVGAAFRDSLRQLSSTMLQTAQQYIRCIKPNGQKKKDLFDGQFVSRQLSYTGVGAVVEIQKKGYPVAMTHGDFIGRYRCVAFEEPALIARTLPPADVCKNLARSAQKLAGSKCTVDILGEYKMQVGKSKVYLKEEVVKFFEKPRREVWGKAAAKLQRVARRRLAKRVFTMVQAHRKGVAAVRDAMKRREMEEAGEKLDALSTEWEKSRLKPSATPRLKDLHRELGELEIEIVNLEQGIEIEGKALTELQSVLTAAGKGKSDKEKYIMLKKAMQVAQEASSGYSPELTEAIAMVQANLDGIVKGLGVDPAALAAKMGGGKKGKKGGGDAAMILDFDDDEGFDDEELDEAAPGMRRKGARKKGGGMNFGGGDLDDGDYDDMDDEEEAGVQRRTGQGRQQGRRIIAMEGMDGEDMLDLDEDAPGQQRKGRKKFAGGSLEDDDGDYDDEDDEAAPGQRNKGRKKFAGGDLGDGDGDDDDDESAPGRANRKKLSPEEEMLAEWEAEIEAERLDRERIRKQKQADLERELRDDEDWEILDVLIRNEIDLAVQGEVTRLKGYTVEGTGVQFNEGNMITVITVGSIGYRDDLLRVGDIALAVDGANLGGEGVGDTMNLKPLTQYTLTIARKRGDRANLPGGEHEGWVYALKAKDGEALTLVERPKKVWMVMEGSVLTLYEGTRGKRIPVSTPLKGALVKAPVTQLNVHGGAGKKLDQPPIIKQLISQRKFPFTITWPANEVEHDIVCAAATSADRSGWIKALNAQLKRMRAGAPTCGWLMKHGSGLKMGVLGCGLREPPLPLQAGLKALHAPAAPKAPV